MLERRVWGGHRAENGGGSWENGRVREIVDWLKLARELLELGWLEGGRSSGTRCLAVSEWPSVIVFGRSGVFTLLHVFVLLACGDAVSSRGGALEPLEASVKYHICLSNLLSVLPSHFNILPSHLSSSKNIECGNPTTP